MPTRGGGRPVFFTIKLFIKNTKTIVTAEKKPQPPQNVNRCNYCLGKCGISWCRTSSTKLNYVIRSVSAPLCDSSAPTLPCGRVEGGALFCTPAGLPFQLFPIEPLSRSKGWPVFMEQYGSVTDIHQMLVIPDHKFLRCARAHCLLLSVCLYALVDLQQNDNTVVPLLCDGVWGQATLPTFLSDKKNMSV